MRMLEAMIGVKLKTSGSTGPSPVTCANTAGAPGIGVKSVPFVDDEIITF